MECGHVRYLCKEHCWRVLVQEWCLVRPATRSPGLIFSLPWAAMARQSGKTGPVRWAEQGRVANLKAVALPQTPAAVNANREH
jgi:hypothetical protein